MDKLTTENLPLDPKAEECSTCPIDSEIADIGSIEDEMLADELCKQFRLKNTALIIHGFAVAHGCTTLVLGSGADTPFLTAETIGMLYSVFKANNYTTNLPLHLIASTLGSVIAGKIVTSAIGTAARVLILGPGEVVDRAINIPATMLTTEILGWAAFAILSFSDNNPMLDKIVNKKELSSEEKKLIWKTANTYKKKYGKQGKELYKKMSKEDKKSFQKLIKKIQSKDTDDNMNMQI